MHSAIAIYGFFLIICFAGIARPWLGIVGFYFFTVLDPGWNWRWAIDSTFPFQKYIFVCVAIGWLVNGLPGLKYRGKDALPILGLIIFLALAFLSKYNTLDELLSAKYMGHLWKVVVVAILTAITVDTPKKLAVLLTAVVVAQGYNAFQINLQYFQDGYSLYARIMKWGSKGDNNGYSILTIPVLAMSFGIAVSALNSKWRLMALGIALLQMHQIMLLESRGSMVGAMFMCLLFVLAMKKNASNVLVLLLLTVAGAILAGPSVQGEFSSSFASAENRDSSADSRFHLWRAGWEITWDYPLLGVGPWCGSLVVPDYYQGGGVLTQRRKELHNLVFELTTGTGVPATICYLMFFLYPWWQSAKMLWYHRVEMAEQPYLQCVLMAVACGIPGYFAASMFSSGALIETGYILAAAGCSATILSRRYLEDYRSHAELAV